jgi:hypothetical protein
MTKKVEKELAKIYEKDGRNLYETPKENLLSWLYINMHDTELEVNEYFAKEQFDGLNNIEKMQYERVQFRYEWLQKQIKNYKK